MLERASIRGVNPDKWTNWAMFYISLDYVDELINALREYLPKGTQSYFSSLVPGEVPRPKRRSSARR